MKTILRDTHSLDAAGVDNISEQIADVLADYPYITKRDILRLRLGAEEILLHWRQEVGELRVELSIEEKGRWVDLMLQMDGVPYRLTPPDAAEVSGVSGVESTLANLGIDWTYQFDHGQNSAYISVEARESHRVRHVLTAMALAAASAVLLRLLPAAVDVVQNYVTQPLPAFVFLSMLSTGLTADVDTLLSYGRMILLFAAFCTVVTAVQFAYVARRTGYPVGKMWEILRPTFMAQLASACSSSAFSDAYDACERGFGMDRRLVRFALPIGTVIHKPLIAAEFVFVIFAIRDMTGDTMTLGALLLLAVMAFLTSVAYPPVSGGEISCYTVLLLQMGISGDLLAAACALSALFDMVEAPCNTLCTELQLLLTARKHNLMTGGKAAQQHTPEVTR